MKVRKRDRKALDAYVRLVADAMGLRDWNIVAAFGKVKHDAKNKPQKGEDWCATCAPTPGRKHADITFAPYMRDAPREDLRQTTVHELVHVHFYGMWDTLRRDTLILLDQEPYDVWIAGVERHMEYGVDALADALAPHMPLIAWPAGKEAKKCKT